MSKFAGIEKAASSDRLPYIQQGSYLLEIDAVKVISTRGKGDMFIIEAKVLESAGANANEVGSKLSHLIKMSNDSAMGNIKAFVSALTGDSKVTSETVDKIISAENPAAGTKVRADAFNIKTRAGADFTRVNYTYVPEVSPEAAAAKNAPAKAKTATK